jgi:cyclopropane fatty-acyl-phospholipid synthase-like methyltransferase
LEVEIQLRDYRDIITEGFDRVVSVGMVEHVGHKNYPTYMRAAACSLGKDGLFLCQGICGHSSRRHANPWIQRYIFPNSVLPSLARLTRTAEGVFIVEEVKNIGPNYDPTLLSWEENFRCAWPRFADRYANGSGECGDFTCSVALAHLGRAVCKSFRFSFRKKMPPVGKVPAIRDRRRRHRARRFSSQAESPDTPRLHKARATL